MPMCTAVSSRITLISDQITTRASHTLLGSSSVAFQTSIFTFIYVKFIYSEKDIKFCEISTVLLAYVVKSKVEISQNFVAFSEYINFIYIGNKNNAKRRNISSLRFHQLCRNLYWKKLYNDKRTDFLYPFILIIKLLQKEANFWHDLFENDKNAYRY